MQFGLLGPLEVRADGEPVGVGGAKPRAVLATLLLHANAPVSGERLASALWNDDVPHSAIKTVQVYVSRLRKALGDGHVETTPAGYVVRLGDGELDLQRFEELVASARRELARGEPRKAAARLREALRCGAAARSRTSRRSRSRRPRSAASRSSASRPSS